MQLIKTGVLIAFLALSTDVSAQDTRDAELENSDQRLNVTYRTLIRQLDSKDQTYLRVVRNAELPA
jgi:uncharacterized protein YecT (DUF1311 family)